MDKKDIKIKHPNGKMYKGLLWGNNAAWICKCGNLLGDLTGTKETKGVRGVSCSNCGARYKITSYPNKKHRMHLGRAKDVKLCDYRGQKQRG